MWALSWLKCWEPSNITGLRSGLWFGSEVSSGLRDLGQVYRPGLIPEDQRREEERSCLSAAFSCLLGISGHEDACPPLGHLGGCQLPWEMEMGRRHS